MTAAKLIFFVINVLIVAIPVALLEITIEKDKGWGAGHPKNSWYGKIVGQNNSVMKFICKILGVPYMFGYGIAMYFVLIPIILTVEYFFLIQNVFLLLAIFISICAVEDFSWFVFNWHLDSLKQLLKGPNGTIWWHKRWFKIGAKTYLPLSYFTAIPWIVLFYLLAK